MMVVLLIVIGWLYVTLMMAVAEATASNGTLLGAIITFVFYGLLPTSLIAYIFSTPARKRARRAREAAALRAYEEQQRETTAAPVPDNASAALVEPDGSGKAPTTAEHTLVAPVGKKP